MFFIQLIINELVCHPGYLAKGKTQNYPIAAAL